MKKNGITLIILFVVVFAMTTITSCRKDSGEEPYREYNEDSSLAENEYEVTYNE